MRELGVWWGGGSGEEGWDGEGKMEGEGGGRRLVMVMGGRCCVT